MFLVQVVKGKLKRVFIVITHDKVLLDDWKLFGVNKTGATGIHTDRVKGGWTQGNRRIGGGYTQSES